MPMIHINGLSFISGSEIVQWMIKNLDIEDPGKRDDPAEFWSNIS